VSYGKLFLSSVIKSGNKNYLNRVKDELFNDRDRTKDSSATELDWLNFIRRHVMEFRTLPSASVLRSENFEYIETDQPPEYYLEQLVKRAVWNSYKGFAKNMEPLVKHQFDLQRATELITEFSKDVARLSVADKYKSLTELGREIQAQIESRKQGNSEVFIPFGWPTIDRLTGGVTGGDLIYIVARPGVGKSATSHIVLITLGRTVLNRLF
jgi:hypothetical protein